MAVRDFVHDEEIVDAVIAQLHQELPADWLSGESPILRLGRAEFGDLREYRLTEGQTWRSLCPVLLVRLNRSERAPEFGGLGGREGQVVPLRLLHVRTRDQCRSLSKPEDILPPARARAQYAKALSRALFANRNLGAPTLTTEDASARVLELRPRQVLYEGEKSDLAFAAIHGLVALAIDFEVIVRTQ